VTIIVKVGLPRPSWQAEGIAVALPALCELVWVLSRGYKIPPKKIAETIRRLIDGVNVMANRPAVEAGLAILAAGGDFADGVIAYEGRGLGADIFTSLDRNTVTLLEKRGVAARLLS
jgi:predicted nucleic-acid-binding protein